MDRKEYRVVCSKIPHSDNVFIDIAATDELHFGVTHEMLFYSRRRLCGVPIEDCGVGSVFIIEGGTKETNVDFSKGFHAPVGTMEYASYERLCARLKPKILETFEKMRQENKTSTIANIMSMPEVEAYKDMLSSQNRRIGKDGKPVLSDAEAFALREKRKRQQFAEKHRDLLKPHNDGYAQSSGEERRQRILENQAVINQRRFNQMQDRANLESGADVIAIMRRKLNTHDGD